jgi:hypothetical protein
MLFRNINKFFTNQINSFRAKDLQIVLNQNPRRFDVNKETLQFGAIETDHILEINYDENKGW